MNEIVDGISRDRVYRAIAELVARLEQRVQETSGQAGQPALVAGARAQDAPGEPDLVIGLYIVSAKDGPTAQALVASLEKAFTAVSLYHHPGAMIRRDSGKEENIGTHS